MTHNDANVHTLKTHNFIIMKLILKKVCRIDQGLLSGTEYIIAEHVVISA